MSDPEQNKKPKQQLLPSEGFGKSTQYRDSAVDVNINSQTDDGGQCIQDMRAFNVRDENFISPPKGNRAILHNRCFVLWSRTTESLCNMLIILSKADPAIV